MNIGDDSMRLFDILFIRKPKIENHIDLEKEYLIHNKKDNIYGFQKKFYKQSDKLLKIFAK